MDNLQAEAIIDKLIRQHNEQRLHAALGYMTPATWHYHDPNDVSIERARRIAAARAHRKTINQHTATITTNTGVTLAEGRISQPLQNEGVGETCNIRCLRVA